MTVTVPNLHPFINVLDVYGENKRVQISAIKHQLEGNYHIPGLFSDSVFFKCSECGHYDFSPGDDISNYECNGCDAVIDVLYPT